MSISNRLIKRSKRKCLKQTNSCIYNQRYSTKKRHFCQTRIKMTAQLKKYKVASDLIRKTLWLFKVCAKRPFGGNTQLLTDSLIYLKILPPYKRSVCLHVSRLAHTTAHIDRERDFGGSEKDSEFWILTLTVTPHDNPEKLTIIPLLPYCVRTTPLNSLKRFKKKRIRVMTQT